MANQGPKSQTILVVGGGIAGVTAAVEAAETGYDVILLERGLRLADALRSLTATSPNCAIRPAGWRSISSVSAS